MVVHVLNKQKLFFYQFSIVEWTNKILTIINSFMVSAINTTYVLFVLKLLKAMPKSGNNRNRTD